MKISESAVTFDKSMVSAPKISGLFIFLLLTIPLMTVTAGTRTSFTERAFGAGAGAASSCTMKNLEDQVVAAGQVVDQQDAINFAVGSNQYKQATTGFHAAFSGENYAWSYDSGCKVTWRGISINFLMQSANGSMYTLVVSENPLAGVIDGVQTFPALSAAITPQCNSPPYYPPCNWSGYAVAGNSQQNQQIYESDARWYVPTLSEPSGSGQPSCTSTNRCVLAQWVGLTDQTASANPQCCTLLQAGVFSEIYGSPAVPVQKGFTQIYCTYFASWCQTSATICSLVYDPVSVGNQMESTEENQLAYNGTPGNNYYAFLNDWTQSWLCTLPGQPVNITFTPYFAAFMAERNNPSTYHLAQWATSSFYFTLCADYVSSYQGVYSDYNNGYGWGVYMLNNGYQNTITRSMTQVGNGYGQFYVDWSTSQST